MEVYLLTDRTLEYYSSSYDIQQTKHRTFGQMYIPQDIWNYVIIQYLPLSSIVDKRWFQQEFQRRIATEEALEYAWNLDDVDLFTRIPSSGDTLPMLDRALKERKYKIFQHLLAEFGEDAALRLYSYITENHQLIRNYVEPCLDHLILHPTKEMSILFACIFITQCYDIETKEDITKFAQGFEIVTSNDVDIAELYYYLREAIKNWISGNYPMKPSCYASNVLIIHEWVNAILEDRHMEFSWEPNQRNMELINGVLSFVHSHPWLEDVLVRIQGKDRR